MVEILNKIEEVDGRLSVVTINEQRISDIARGIREQDLKVSEIALSRYSWTKEQLLGLIFIFNSINFCYWAEKGKEKWTMTFGEEKLDGATALFRALEEEMLRDDDFIHGRSLDTLTENDLHQVLKGNVEIPMFQERVKISNEVGRILSTKYNGSFVNLFNQSNKDSMKLMSLVISNFPSFFDEEEFRGVNVPFYKRAQLNSKMVSDALVSVGEQPLANLDKLTAFADYKIPQILRSFGIIEYASDLSQRIDNQDLIEKGSPEEIEIRIATILSVEKMRQELLKRFPWVTSSHVDSMLWNRSQDKTLEVKPYHRTYTTSY